MFHIFSPEYALLLFGGINFRPNDFFISSVEYGKDTKMRREKPNLGKISVKILDLIPSNAW